MALRQHYRPGVTHGNRGGERRAGVPRFCPRQEAQHGPPWRTFPACSTLQPVGTNLGATLALVTDGEGQDAGPGAGHDGGDAGGPQLVDQARHCASSPAPGRTGAADPRSRPAAGRAAGSAPRPAGPSARRWQLRRRAGRSPGAACGPWRWTSWPGGTKTTGTTSGDGSSRAARTPPAALPRDGEATEHARGHVVRVAFQLVGQDERRVVVERLLTAEGERPCCHDAGTDGGGRRPQAAAVRDAVGGVELDAPGLTAEPGEGRLHCPYHKVFGRTRHLLGALSGHIDGDAFVGHPYQQVVVQTQRQSERIEARSEVGRRRRHPDPYGGAAERGLGH